jgi:hypothetical protein
VVVEGLYHRIAAAAAGFWRESREEAAPEASQGRQEHEQPRSKGSERITGREGLAMGAEDSVARQVLQQEPLNVFQPSEEQCAGEPRRHSDQRGMEHHASRETQIERCRLREDDRKERPVARRPPEAGSRQHYQKASARHAR